MRLVPVPVLAAAIALTNSGCFCIQRAESCVQSGVVCTDLTSADCLDDTIDDGRSCAATRLDGTCAANGYTVSCGSYSVRPGGACGPVR